MTLGPAGIITISFSVKLKFRLGEYLDYFSAKTIDLLQIMVIKIPAKSAYNELNVNINGTLFGIISICFLRNLSWKVKKSLVVVIVFISRGEQFLVCYTGEIVIVVYVLRN